MAIITDIITYTLLLICVILKFLMKNKQNKSSHASFIDEIKGLEKSSNFCQATQLVTERTRIRINCYDLSPGLLPFPEESCRELQVAPNCSVGQCYCFLPS